MDGVVTEEPDSKGNVSVRIGSFNTMVTLQDLTAQLTVEELAALTVGASRGGFGGISTVGAASDSVQGRKLPPKYEEKTSAGGFSPGIMPGIPQGGFRPNPIPTGSKASGAVQGGGTAKLPNPAGK